MLITVLVWDSVKIMVMEPRFRYTPFEIPFFDKSMSVNYELLLNPIKLLIAIEANSRKILLFLCRLSAMDFHTRLLRWRMIQSRNYLSLETTLAR